MGGTAPPAASARDPFTAFRASRITTIAVSSSTSRWWVRRASSALTSFSVAGSRSAAVRLVSIASVRLPRRRWGVVHIAADPPVDPPEPDAARLRGPALALRRPCGGSPDHSLALWPAHTDLPDQTRGGAQVLVLEARVRRDDRGDAAARPPADRGGRGRSSARPGPGPHRRRPTGCVSCRARGGGGPR